MALKLKLTVLYLSPLLVCGCRVDVGMSKQQRHFNRLLLRSLPNLSDIDCELSQRSHMLFVNKLNIRQLSLIKYYPHDRLTSADRTIDLRMHFINTDRITLPHKSIKDVFTKLLPFYDHLLALRMDICIEDGQSVNSIGLFSDS